MVKRGRRFTKETGETQNRNFNYFFAKNFREIQFCDQKVIEPWIRYLRRWNKVIKRVYKQHTAPCGSETKGIRRGR